ncbi:hypothetical protein COBT_002841, partial [Conglomerata obtusa]
MQNRNYKKSNRKFHDAWAFILFVVFTLVANFFYFREKSNDKSIFIPDKKMVIIGLTYFPSFMLLCTIGLLLFPAPLMHAACILNPIVSVCLAIWLQYIPGIICAVIFAALSYGLYFFSIRHHIKYSAVIASTSVYILLKNLVIVLPVILLVLGLINVQFFTSIMNMGKEYGDNYLFYIFLTLQMYWVFFASLYFLRVYASTAVALDIITVGTELSTATESIKNTLYALGSICFGSLLVAIVQTLRHLHDKSGRERDRGIGGVILFVVVAVILSLLQSIIEFINDWVFVYIAVYGTPYVKSIKNAYDVLFSGKNRILVNDLCLTQILSLLSLFSLFGYVGILELMDVNYYDISIVGTICMGFIGIMCVSLYLTTFESAAKAFLFTHDVEPYSVKNKYPKAYDALK